MTTITSRFTVIWCESFSPISLIWIVWHILAFTWYVLCFIELLRMKRMFRSNWRPSTNVFAKKSRFFAKCDTWQVALTWLEFLACQRSASSWMKRGSDADLHVRAPVVFFHVKCSGLSIIKYISLLFPPHVDFYAFSLFQMAQSMNGPCS